MLEPNHCRHNLKNIEPYMDPILFSVDIQDKLLSSTDS